MPKINKIRVDGIDYDIEGTVGKQNTEGSSGEIFNDYTNNKATGDYSSASGKGTRATNEAETAVGKYNVSNPGDIFTIGIGGSDVERKNALEVNNQGDVFIIGIGGYDGVTTKDKKHLKQILDNIEAGTGVVAEQLGKETKGSNTKFIYLNEGRPVESNANVGTTTKPIYLRNGEFVACDDKVNEILNLIKTDGAGDKFLADDGTYKFIEVTGGCCSEADYVKRDRGNNKVSTLTSLPIDKSLIIANLASATSFSLSSDMEIGDAITIICLPSETFTQPIPDTRNYISLDGGTLDFEAGKPVEINIYCFDTGKYSLSSKIADDIATGIQEVGLLSDIPGTTNTGSSISTMAAYDDQGLCGADYVKRDRGNNKVTTLTNLPIDKSLVIATLSGATNITLNGAMEIGDRITIMCFPTADFTQAIPTSGEYISMDGSAINAKQSGYFEISIYCYDTSKYSISSKVKK